MSTTTKTRRARRTRKDPAVSPGLTMQAAGGKGEIWIFGRIGDFFFEDGVSSKRFTAELQKLGEVDELIVHINSPGGVAHEGQAIYNALKDHAAQVIVSIEGAAWSAASMIAMAGDEIRMHANSTLMIHEPATFAFGFATDLRKAADDLDQLRKIVIDVYADRSGAKQDQVEEWMANETTFSAKEAKRHGFADKIVPNKKKPKQAGSPVNWAERLKTLGGLRGLPQVVVALGDDPEDTNPPQRTPAMNLAELKAQHPDLVKQIGDEAAQAAETKVKAELNTERTAAEHKAALDKAEREATAAEMKRQTEIRALCATAGEPKLAETYCGDTQFSVDDVRAKLFEQLCKKNKAPSGDDPAGEPVPEGSSKDPEKRFKKEYSDNRVSFVEMGISEKQYVRSRMIDEGLEPLAVGAAAEE